MGTEADFKLAVIEIRLVELRAEADVVAGLASSSDHDGSWRRIYAIIIAKINALEQLAEEIAPG